MAGIEDIISEKNHKFDETDGIIPQAIHYMWNCITSRQEQYYIKASFIEIYNEQIRDLLNPSSGVLHCRWNVKNGFFVENLMVVDCTSTSDLMEVVKEGMRMRKSGSHELNKDSSRSHSIMTIYAISDIKSEDGHILRKFGKICFVDLAGSERLKESKSQGDMIKETGNINKSLFTLGQVISCLSTRKKAMPHIPYRDSKLTMLLMDSLGGTARALMVACISPSVTYLEETISTLNYATSTMNIRNQPIIQMDAKDQIILNMNREVQLLKIENQYIKQKIWEINGGQPIDLPSITLSNYSEVSLPPISNSTSNSLKPVQHTGPSKKLLDEYETELNKAKDENSQYRYKNELIEKQLESKTFDNNALLSKLDNLESVFVGSPVKKFGNTHSNGYYLSKVFALCS
jgi:kinesin family protein 12